MVSVFIIQVLTIHAYKMVLNLHKAWSDNKNILYETTITIGSMKDPDILLTAAFTENTTP